MWEKISPILKVLLTISIIKARQKKRNTRNFSFFLSKIYKTTMTNGINAKADKEE